MYTISGNTYPTVHLYKMNLGYVLPEILNYVDNKVIIATVRTENATLSDNLQIFFLVLFIMVPAEVDLKILTIVTIKMSVFLDATSCRLVDKCRHFRGS